MLNTWENQLQRSADYLRSQFLRSQSVVGWFCSLWAAVRMNWCHDGMEWQDQVPGLMGSKKQRSRPEEGTRAKFTFLRQVHIDLLPPSKFTSQAASPPSRNLFKFNLWWIDPLTMTTQPLLKAVSVATVPTRKQAFNQQLFPVRLGGHTQPITILLKDGVYYPWKQACQWAVKVKYLYIQLKYLSEVSPSAL